MKSLFAILLFAVSVFAQNPYVKLSGTLEGPNGLPAANEIISLTPTQMFFVAGSGTSSCGEDYIFEINGVQLVPCDTINFNNTVPTAPTNGLNVEFSTSKSGSTDSVSAAVVGDGNPAHCLSGTGTYVNCSGAGSGGGNPILENCTPDQTGNSFYTVASLTNWFAGHWEFVFNTTTYINCEVFIPTAASGATLVLDIFTNDATAGHAALFQTCDTQITTGTLQVGSLTCASAQTYTTTSTAYQRVTLTFNVQSTLVNNGMLVVKIGTSPTGTAPAANMLVFPHFIL
jgi:hypothetical protein